AACAYSICSKVFKEEDTAKLNIYADRAIRLIKESVSKGYSNYSQMQADADLDPIRETEGFTRIMKAGNLELRYAAVWNTSNDGVKINLRARRLAQFHELRQVLFRFIGFAHSSMENRS
ncbi:unnamed protein product, partial [marine sediment metagenome]